MASVSFFYPIGVSIPNHQANDLSTLTLLSIFGILCVLWLALLKVIITRVNPQISTLALSKALWFALCAAIHFILEGYYSSHFTTLQGSQDILAQMWKEYALSDSRYLTKDAFVMVMESVTAFVWGPLSLVMTGLITLDHPFQHPLQILISTGQLYGDVLYFGIAAFDMVIYGIHYSRPEVYYYYGYYVMLNAFWIVIPGMLILDSFQACKSAFTSAKKLGSNKKTS